ncbi:Hypothetical predicted protein [Cloeon dipterum]|uniref:Sushi domain-containing protein n=1 Tax=Cloeon dipterum TaxID=197152 RepID=A0A8S1C759_9INSE|nr:Hypothetical predicted protein [Cloeon dipterum]
MLFSLAALVFLPSIFAATVEKRIEKRSTFVAVDLSRVDTRDLLNRAGYEECNPPRTDHGLYRDCRARDRSAFPARSAECFCAQCAEKSFKLFCSAGKWYLHPDHYDLPCKHCNNKACTQPNRQFECRSQQIGGAKSVKSDCTCLHDCLDYDLECDANGQWMQKKFIDSNGHSFVCNSEKKVMRLGYRSIEYDKGLITVRCEKGYKTDYHNKLSCINGFRNGTIPECILEQRSASGKMSNTTLYIIVFVALLLFLALVVVLSVLLLRKCRNAERSEITESPIYATPGKAQSSN